ncbi:hypothetical protein HY230_02480 [Candidatus Acetothermia bacterium]|nr:hypothetical protein [Candidatus Acetothermia bacterium]
MSRHCMAAVIALVVMGFVGITSLAQDKLENLSAGRGPGVGLQGPCLFSIRYWVSDQLGFEANGFALTNEFVSSPGGTPVSKVFGCAAGKLLYKLGDGRSLDFYLGAWAELPFGNSPFSNEPPVPGAALLGGLEWSLLQNFEINFEFGEQFKLSGKVDFAFSLGMHYYFMRAAAKSK